MPEIVDMEQTLKLFREAVARGLPLHKCSTDESVFIHPDNPNGIVRFTFCKMENEKPISIVAFVQSEHHDGIPCFNVGYATEFSQRKRGLAKELLKTAINDFKEGLKRQDVADFYLEAGVEKNNIASQKIASDVFQVDPVDSVDPDSGTPTFGYLCKASTLNFG